VWGAPCHDISAEWGSQRVKGLSVLTAIRHYVRQLFAANGDMAQKQTETSLIERFLYPKYGPGQLWEEVARRVTGLGGELLTGWEVREIHTDGPRVVAVTAVHRPDGEQRRFEGGFFFSTMPVKALVAGLRPAAPPQIRSIADGLVYRDFITVGLLVRKLKVVENGGLIKDNWIYIQEPDVLAGRMQIFNNWSPYMVADAGNVWIGLEYFCFESDPIWRQSDQALADLAKSEMEKIGILDPADVLDAAVIRVEKTYPAYFGAYARFAEVRRHLDGFENLFLIGRNGMHRYNNQDHSMLTAMVAVDNIVSGTASKENIWAVNTEQEYHEEK